MQNVQDVIHVHKEGGFETLYAARDERIRMVDIKNWYGTVFHRAVSKIISLVVSILTNYDQWGKEMLKKRSSNRFGPLGSFYKKILNCHLFKSTLLI